MDEFPELAPTVSILHYQKMVMLGDEMGDQGSGSVRVDVTPSVEKSFNEHPVGDDESGALETLQGEYTTVFPGPFCQPFQR